VAACDSVEQSAEPIRVHEAFSFGEIFRPAAAQVPMGHWSPTAPAWQEKKADFTNF